jgi:hypothetical protein
MCDPLPSLAEQAGLPDCDEAAYAESTEPARFPSWATRGQPPHCTS